MSARKRMYRVVGFTLVFALGLVSACSSSNLAETEDGPFILLRNNYEFSYEGPLRFRTPVLDGHYVGEGGHAWVEDGIAHVTASLDASSESLLRPAVAAAGTDPVEGPYAIEPLRDGLEIRRAGAGTVGRMAFDLVVVPGSDAGPADAVAAFKPLAIEWLPVTGGALVANVLDSGYRIEFTLLPHQDGWFDVDAVVTREDDDGGDAYVALLRRIDGSVAHGMRMRWNGREVDGPTSPQYWERDFWYTRGVDWTRWQAEGHDLLSVNRFTPSPIILDDSGARKVVANHFYVWERARAEPDGMYLISEIAGPNPEQVKSRYMPVRPYTPPSSADTLELGWRLAVAQEPPDRWEDAHLHVYAGYRFVESSGARTTVDLGTPHVSFGTSYFPYSTFPENFDFYRTPGLNKETWWASSPDMWAQWRSFVPQMQTDLRIIKAMGFEWVRLHYLGLLQLLPREEALAFLDFYTGEARVLGLKVLADSEGPAEWLAAVAGRYPDVIKRVELENEILIMGIEPGDPERWTDLYRAVKGVAPETEVFLTGAGANGMFEALQDLGVPFDRIGLHAYKHGPEGKDAFSSHVLGTGGYAVHLGMQPTLAEFNWKNLTRLSPEERREEFRVVYEEMLEPRAMPEFYQFHFQETLSVNPSISRSGIRHYETIYLDRRPKPEAQELMRLIRRYAHPEATVRELAIDIPEVSFSRSHATSSATITNKTQRSLDVDLATQTFGQISSEVASREQFRLRPGESVQVSLSLSLHEDAPAGTYHHFVVAEYDHREAFGWGVAANEGAPTFEASVLGDLVQYPTGEDIVAQLDWTRPIAVAFGAEAPWLEMEMSYIVANTLQAATGREVRISSAEDTPASFLRDGTVIAVGTPRTNPLVDPAQLPEGIGEAGIILGQRASGGTPAALVLTGRDRHAVQAAATDFVLRYWQNAKDAAIRITGMEPGAALGNPVVVTNPDPP